MRNKLNLRVNIVPKRINKLLDKYLYRLRKKEELTISLSLAVVVLFFAIALIAPFKSQLLSTLFKKGFIHATGTLNSDDWPQLGHDAQRTNDTPSNIPPGPYRFYWRWTNTPFASRVQPVVVGGVLYIGSLNGTFYAVNATADNQGGPPTIIWQKVLNIYDPSRNYGNNIDNITPDPVRSGAGVDVSTGTVIVGTQHGTIYGLDTTSGNVKWTVFTGGAIVASPLLDEAGTVYIGSSDGYFYSINTATGAINWKTEIDNTISSSVGTSNLPVPILGSAALSTDGTQIYLVAENVRAYALSSSNGSIVWSTQLQGQSEEGRAPVVYHNLTTGVDEIFIRTQPIENFTELLKNGDCVLNGNYPSNCGNSSSIPWSTTDDTSIWSQDWNLVRPNIETYLQGDPSSQTIFALNGSNGQPITGSIASVPPVLYTYGVNQTPSSPALYNNELYLPYRPRHGIQTDNGSVHVTTQYDAELGMMDPSTFDITNIATDSASVGFHYQFRLTSDEPASVSVAGNYLLVDSWERLGGLQLTNATTGNLIDIATISNVNGSCQWGIGDALYPYSDAQFYDSCSDLNNISGNVTGDGESREGVVVSSNRIFWHVLSDGLGALGNANNITDSLLPTVTPPPTVAPLPAPISTPSASTLINDYVWNVPTRPVSTPSADLVSELSSAVQSIVNSNQHLLPYYFENGYPQSGSWPPDSGNGEPAEVEINQWGNHGFWYDQGELLYTLSIAYPYLSSSLQSQVKTYIQSQMINLFPPLSALPYGGSWPWETQGQSREYFPVPSPIRTGSENSWPPPTPPLQTLYALWAYGNYTGDWSYIDANWQNGTIQSFFTSKTQSIATSSASPTAVDSYAEIAGAIGYARIAQHEGDTTQAQNGANIAASDMSAGITNLNNWTDIANTLYPKSQQSGNSPAEQIGSRGQAWWGLVPEVGHYLHDTNLPAVNDLLSPLIDVNNNDGCYLWYITMLGTQCQLSESSRQSPEIGWSVFLTQAYIEGDNQQQLRYFLDRPWGLGDPWYIQKIVATIEAPNPQSTGSVVGVVSGGTATFSANSTQSTVSTGGTIPVQIYADSETDAANLFSAKLTFNPQVLSVSSIDPTGSFVTTWAEKYFDNTNGNVSITGGVVSPGIKTTTPQLLATVNFTPLTSGSTTINFDNTNSVIYRNSDNADILGSTTNYTFIISPIPTQSSTPTLTVTPTMTPTLTLTPTPTVTLTPTPTPTLTVIPTMTPTPTPTTGLNTPTPTITVVPTLSITPGIGGGLMGDANGDGRVDLQDMSALFTDWCLASCNPVDVPYTLDFNHDGVINSLDYENMLNILLSNGTIHPSN